MFKKKLVVFLLLFASAGLYAQNIKGFVQDENDAAMPFATVALRSLPDSSVVSGAVTDEAGLFCLEGKGDVVEISMIGYKTLSIPVSSISDAFTVKMVPDARMLEEAKLTVTLPKTELKGDAVVTNIVGSVLEHSGNTYDVLARIPGMISLNGSLQVIGRGTPVYYLNGRKVTDDSELRNLMSEDIRSIDVVSNPGAIYGGEVRCVVRIRTIKHQGEGLGFALTSQAKQHIYDNHDFEPSWSVLDLNYRVKGWDFFGKLVYWNQRGYQFSDYYGGTYTAPKGEVINNFQEGRLGYTGHNGGLQYVGGANWHINEKHSLGFKLDYKHNSFTNNSMFMYADVFHNAEKIDVLESLSDTDAPKGEQFSGNLYYDGNIEKLNINFNADYLITSGNQLTHVSERGNAPVEIDSRTSGGNTLGAGKLILSYPVWKGSLQAGSEETYVASNQTYWTTLDNIPSSNTHIVENTIAGFVQYSIGLPFGMFSAGLRYEHVNFNYTDTYNSTNDLSRVQNNWFPSFSFSTQLKDVGLNLSYTGKTVRPNYSMLSTSIDYDNRFTYQTGDPKMLNEIQRTLSFMASWKWLSFSANYENVENSFFQLAYPYNDEGVVMVQYANVKNPVNKINFYLNASPTVKFWNPRFTVGMEKQFFSTTVSDPRVEEGKRTVSLNKPMYLAQWDNSLRFKYNWLLEVNYQYISPFDQLIAHIVKPTQRFGMAVSKSFLKNEALNVKLSWTDILNSSLTYIETDYGNCEVRQSNDWFNPCVQLLVSYRFNSAKSKYKGTGAGESAKNRM